MTACSMQVDDEAIAAMDDDAAAHWKRYVGESPNMDRGMLERVLRFVCAHLNPFSILCRCLWAVRARHRVSVCGA